MGKKQTDQIELNQATAPAPDALALTVALAAADQVAIEHGHDPRSWLAPDAQAEGDNSEALASLASFAVANPNLDGEVYYRHGAALGTHAGAAFDYFNLPVWARLAYGVFSGVLSALGGAQAKEAKLAEQAAQAARPPAPSSVQGIPIEDTILEQQADPLATHEGMVLSKPATKETDGK